jgi:hypothetical protein
MIFIDALSCCTISGEIDIWRWETLKTLPVLELWSNAWQNLWLCRGSLISFICISLCQGYFVHSEVSWDLVLLSSPGLIWRSQDKPGNNFIIVSDIAAAPLNSDTSFNDSTSKTIASKFVHAPSFNNKAGIPLTEPLNSLAAWAFSISL